MSYLDYIQSVNPSIQISSICETREMNIIEGSLSKYIYLSIQSIPLTCVIHMVFFSPGKNRNQDTRKEEEECMVRKGEAFYFPVVHPEQFLSLETLVSGISYRKPGPPPWLTQPWGYGEKKIL